MYRVSHAFWSVLECFLSISPKLDLVLLDEERVRARIGAAEAAERRHRGRAAVRQTGRHQTGLVTYSNTRIF